MRPPHLLRITRANNVHPCPHHIRHRRSRLLQSPLDILQSLHRLRVSIPHAHNLPLRVRRGRARHPHIRPHTHRPRIPNHRLPRRSTRKICSRHQVPPSQIPPQPLSSHAHSIFYFRFSIFRRSTDQIAPATPPAQSDTNPRACQTLGNESAPQSRKPNQAAGPARRSALRPKLPTRRPIAEEYARTTRTAPAIPHHASKPPHYPAIPPVAPPEPAQQTSSPARAQTETPALHDRAAKQTSPPDDTTRNVHRKKDIPPQARQFPPEKHSTSAAHARASRRPCRAPHQSQRYNRNHGNAPPFPLATVSENL